MNLKLDKTKLLIIIILGFFIYLPSLNGPFLFDDERSIYLNSLGTSLDKALQNFSLTNFRYFSQITFAANFEFSGMQTFTYHLINLLIHLCATVVVYYLADTIIKLTEEKRSTKSQPQIAFFTALIFLTHPLQTQAVSYISQRYASLATLFYLLTCYLYLQGRRLWINEKTQEKAKVFLFASAFTALLALYSKEIALSLPLMIFGSELFFFKKNRLKKFLLGLIGSCVFFTWILLTRGLDALNAIIISPLGEQISSYNYLLTQSRVFWKYVQLFFWPLRQSADYYFPISTSLTDWRVLLSTLAIIILFIIAILNFKKNKLISFSFFWIFIALSVESTILPIDDVIFEHRLYLPSFGFAFLFSYLVLLIINWDNDRSLKQRNQVKYQQQFKSRSFIESKQIKNRDNLMFGLDAPGVYQFMMTVIIFFLSLLAFKRNFIWTNEINFWADVVTKAPQKAKGYGALAVAYDRVGDYQHAIKYYEKTLAINPGLADLSVKVHNNLGFTYFNLGNYDKALSEYNQVFAIAPNFAQTHLNAAQVYTAQTNYEQAVIQLQAVLVTQPNSFIALHNLGVTYLQMENKDQAKKYLLQALEVNPNSQETKLMLTKLPQLQ